MRIAYQPVPIEDYELPNEVRDTFDSFNVKIGALAQLIDRAIQRAGTFLIPGKGRVPKDRVMEEIGPWPLEFKHYGGTLAQARKLGAKRGWDVCDGSAGTPDLRDKFIMGASATENAGGTGGNATHTHTFTGGGHTHPLDNAVIEAVADHTHALDGTSCAGGGHEHSVSGNVDACTSTFSACAGATAVSVGAHVHAFSATTGYESSHTHAVSFATAADGAHTPDLLDQDTDNAAASGTTDASGADAALPPYYKAIILRKREWNH